MKYISMILKSGLGLIYTTVIMWLTEFALIFGTIWLIKCDWSWWGIIALWLIGLPIIVGLFQFLATLLSIPVAYLMKGSKQLGYIIVLPALYFTFSFGRFLWLTASAIGGIFIWLCVISVFIEFAWLFGAYCFVSISSAFESPND